MIIRRTKHDESCRVNELFAIAFEQPLTNGPADPQNSKVQHWAAFEDDDRTMMSTFTISDYQLHFDGQACRMGGIGGVATLPQYRRRGGIRGCFEAALPAMYKEGYDFSYLYPFSTRYYRKFGYECCVQKLDWIINLALLDPPRVSGSLHLAESNLSLTDAVIALDRQWEQKYNMMVIHSEADYQWLREAAPAQKQEFTYVYSDSTKVPKAYCTFRMVNETDGRNLVCSRFCFADKVGFYGLMWLFKSMASDHAHVKFKTPVDSSLQYLIPEWSQGAAQWSIFSNAGMLRIIHAKHALEKARYIGSGSIVLQIKDDQIAENNRTFEVFFSSGRAVSVETTDSLPDASMSISTFSVLLAGVCDFQSAAQFFDGLHIRNTTASFDQVFYRKPMMITDYF